MPHLSELQQTSGETDDGEEQVLFLGLTEEKAEDVARFLDKVQEHKCEPKLIVVTGAERFLSRAQDRLGVDATQINCVPWVGVWDRAGTVVLESQYHAADVIKEVIRKALGRSVEGIDRDRIVRFRPGVFGGDAWSAMAAIARADALRNPAQMAYRPRNLAPFRERVELKVEAEGSVADEDLAQILAYYTQNLPGESIEENQGEAFAGHPRVRSSAINLLLRISDEVSPKQQEAVRVSLRKIMEQQVPIGDEAPIRETSAPLRAYTAAVLEIVYRDHIDNAEDKKKAVQEGRATAQLLRRRRRACSEDPQATTPEEVSELENAIETIENRDLAQPKVAPSRMWAAREAMQERAGRFWLIPKSKDYRQ